MNNSSTIFTWNDKAYYDYVKSCDKNPITPYILEYLSKDGLILEAGCGLGHFVKFLSNNGYKKVSGAEINKKAVDSCNRLEPNLDVKFGDVSNLDYENNYFDGIISLGVIEHFIDGPEAALNEMYRVLKQGGTGIISTPCFNGLRIIKKYTGLSFLEYYLRLLYYFLYKKDASWLYNKENKIDFKYKFNRWPVKGKFFEYRFTKKELENAIEKSGFKIIKRVPLEGLNGLYHDLGGKFVNVNNPHFIIKFLDRFFSFIPFFHNHTYLCIVKK